MLAETLIVIGLSLEVSGGALVAGEVLFARPEEVATRGMIFTSSGTPQVEAQRGPSFVWVGVALVALGFVLQLVGALIGSNEWVLVVVAAVTIGATFAVGRWMAAPLVQRRLHRHALKEAARRGLG
jgi:O-antigen/teichoic acid export membrane protein